MTDNTTITDSERDLLRFPAHADGLLRRGSPVWMQWLPAAVEPVALCAPHRDFNGEMRVCVNDGGASPLLSLVSLDLTDATGRAHLAWWIARQIRHHYGGTLDPSEGVRWHRSHRGYWELHAQRADEHRRWQEVCFLPWDGDDDVSDRNGGPHATWCRFVPSLATLDPNDPRLLPDGSRLVDALALSLVGRHLLAGGGK